MAIATITQTGYTQDGTKLAFLNALNNTMVNSCGYTLHDQYDDGTNDHFVWSYAADGTKTYGTAYLGVSTSTASANRFSIWGAATWDNVNHTGTFIQLNKDMDIVATAGTSHNFVACSHPEVRGVMLLDGNGKAIHYIGYVRPVVESWWDENVHPCFFIPRNNDRDDADMLSLGTISTLTATSTSNRNTGGVTRIHLTRRNSDNGNKAGVRAAAINFNNADVLPFTDCVVGASEGMSLLDTWGGQFALFDGILFTTTYSRFGVRVA